MMNRSREERDGTIVYVGGLLSKVKKEEIESEFERFGNLLRVWVAFNPPGFAFVEFSNKEDAEAAVNALHNATVLGSRLRVEISRGRSRGGRGGGMPGRSGGKGGANKGGRGSDFAQGRGGFGGGRPTPYDRNGGDMKPFSLRGGMGGRFSDFDDSPSGFDDRDFGFGGRSIGGTRDFGSVDAPRFGGIREERIGFRDIDGRSGFGNRDIGGGRDFPLRDLEGRDFPSRDIGGRDFTPRDGFGIPPRNDERDFLPRNYAHDFRDGRGTRNFGNERETNGIRGYGGSSRDMPYGGNRDIGVSRDFGVNQTPGPTRDYVPPGRDIGRARDFGASDLDLDPVRDYGDSRDVGFRRETVRDFNAPRDITDFGGRGTRANDSEIFGNSGGRSSYDNMGAMRAGGFESGRFPGGDIGGSGNYGDYGARDRFRTRSPIGRGRPIY